MKRLRSRPLLPLTFTDRVCYRTANLLLEGPVVYRILIAFVVCTGVLLGCRKGGAQNTPVFESLGFHVVDAEYSRPLDRIIVVGAEPNRLHSIDPLTKEDKTVDLPAVPTCVSVSPDGHLAAVGHARLISIVDLVTNTFVKSLTVDTSVLDVVLAGNGYVYAMPLKDQWEQIHGVNIETGIEELSASNSIYAGTLAKLHPDGRKIYGADNHLSPQDIERYDIADGKPEVSYDSPYHGTYPMCGNLWISDDGKRIFTACGRAFNSTDDRSTDMTYAGRLEDINVMLSADQSTAAGLVVAIPANSDREPFAELRVFDNSDLTLSRTIVLPRYDQNSRIVMTYGEFVFFNSTGTRIVALVKADINSGIEFDESVLVFDAAE